MWPGRVVQYQHTGGRHKLSLYTCKKGSRKQYKNYWGVTLLSVLGKVYATVLDKRIRAEDRVLEEQGAFRRKRSCIDQIFTVRQGRR